MFEEATTIIESRLIDNWLATPIDFDNVGFKPVRGTAFIRVQVVWVDTTNVSVGGMDRGTGYVLFSIFTPVGEGSKQALAYADQLAFLYNRYTSGNLTCNSASTNRIGQVEEWYQVNALVPFKYDNCF